jgi:GT2 family glycosyltransferase
MDAFPASLVISPTSRWPTTLPEATVRAVLARPLPNHFRPFSRQVQEPLPALASIVVVSQNNLVYTRLCLESLLAHTDRPGYEVIVIDNGSDDGTCEYLRGLADRQREVRIIFNAHNHGFARATNQGLVKAQGQFLILLNNDTIVPRGWLERLLSHLAAPEIGLVGPCTNRCGNEAQIEVGYRIYGEMVEFAGAFQGSRQPQAFDIRTAAMFCAAMRRDTYERMGPLDEQFEVGLFEDDDYAMRIRAAGYRVVCALDVFVHHFGQASIGKLAATGEYGQLFQANRSRWERKWQQPWTPYRRRDNPEYLRMIDRLREIAGRVIRPGATVLVASKGDEECVRLDGVHAWHFPRSAEGQYAGHHPAGSTEAIAHLESLRREGGEFFLLPETARWWLDYYAEFLRHLYTRYRVVADEEKTCLIFALGDREAPAAR